MLTRDQQRECLELLYHAKNACWDRSTRKFSAIALIIDNFFATIEDNEIAFGLEWEYIDRRKPEKVSEGIVGDNDDIFS
jgi:hypothetical protein